MEYSFKTKKSLEDYTRKFLDDIRKDKKRTYIVEGEEKRFLLWLFSRHPENSKKTANGIKYITVGPNITGKPHVTIIDNNDEEEAISWLTCVRGRPKTKNAIVANDMRKAIVSQVLDFKNTHRKPNGMFECFACKEEVEKVEIDHVKNFSQLKNDFLSINQQVGTWPEYHLKHAQLQLLCVKCHLCKTNGLSIQTV